MLLMLYDNRVNQEVAMMGWGGVSQGNCVPGVLLFLPRVLTPSRGYTRGRIWIMLLDT